MDSFDDITTIRTWLEFEPEDEPDTEPRYAPAAVAARVGIHIHTIRRYEQYGLVEPHSAARGRTLYSDADVEDLRRIRRLTDDLGVNLAGVAAILHLRRQLVTLQREMAAIRRQRGGS
ncbi:MAG: MerR family transcriptional regulator [Chloroflexota bacterium]